MSQRFNLAQVPAPHRGGGPRRSTGPQSPPPPYEDQEEFELEWEANDEYNVIVHRDHCNICAQWFEHFCNDLDGDDPLLTDVWWDRIETSGDRLVRINELEDRVRQLDAQIARGGTLLDQALDANERLRAANTQLERQLELTLRPDSARPRPHKRPRHAPSSPNEVIDISSTESSPSPSTTRPLADRSPVTGMLGPLSRE